VTRFESGDSDSKTDASMEWRASGEARALGGRAGEEFCEGRREICCEGLADVDGVVSGEWTVE